MLCKWNTWLRSHNQYNWNCHLIQNVLKSKRLLIIFHNSATSYTSVVGLAEDWEDKPHSRPERIWASQRNIILVGRYQRYQTIGYLQDLKEGSQSRILPNGKLATGRLFVNVDIPWNLNLWYQIAGHYQSSSSVAPLLRYIRQLETSSVPSITIFLAQPHLRQ